MRRISLQISSWGTILGSKRIVEHEAYPSCMSNEWIHRIGERYDSVIYVDLDHAEIGNLSNVVTSQTHMRYGEFP